MFAYIYTADGLVQVNKLSHHGVKGQKWGVRRKRKENVSEDYARAHAYSKKTTKEMSNVELAEYNKRRQLELNHQQITRQKGYNYVKPIIDTGKLLTSLLAAYSATKKGYQLVRRIINGEEHW